MYVAMKQLTLYFFLCSITLQCYNTLAKFSFDVIYQFGDSLSDTGNLVAIVGPNTRTANLPYGQTFGRPTGRSSDGLLMVDYFAMDFRMPLLNAFLANGSDFNHGANFAVAGATALDIPTLASRNVTLRSSTNYSLVYQLAWFKSHLQSICVHPIECEEKLQKSIVIVGTIGGNDYTLALTQGRTLKEVYELVPMVVNTTKYVVEEVIKLGAVNIMVPGSIPRGCLPSNLVRFATNDSSNYDYFGCLKELNAFARYHNNQLKRVIQMLRHQYPAVAIAYGDLYSATTWILENAASLGFEEENLHTTCCGIGNNPYNYDPNRPCGRDSPVCADPNKRLNWDGRHFTQQAYNYMSSWLLDNSFSDIYINV